MPRNIKCTNPICTEIITVPEGTLQIICPSCNTWHFPEPSDQHEEASGYGQPHYQESNPVAYNTPPTEQHIEPEFEQEPAIPGQANEPYQPTSDPIQSPPIEFHNPHAKPDVQQDEGVDQNQNPYQNQESENRRHDGHVRSRNEEIVDDKIAYLLTDTGERMLLKEGRNVIGRKNADLIISNKTVSRRHGVLEVTKKETGNWEYILFDIGHIESTPSTNGVYITGRTQRLANYERLRIGHGTCITIGNINLTLQNI